jgi:hypothetical protein
VKTIKFEAELTYDDKIMHDDDPSAEKWFYDEVLLGDRDGLTLFSSLVGDLLGTVRVSRVILEYK